MISSYSSLVKFHSVVWLNICLYLIKNIVCLILLGEASEI